MDKERKVQLRESFHRSKIMTLFKATATGVTKGYFEITVPKQDFMVRTAGMFNGSTMATLVDVSAGYAAASVKPSESYLTTVELKVNYLNPAMGEMLVAKAQVVKNGKTLTVVRSDIYAVSNGKETLVATSLVTLMSLAQKAPDAQID
ncbi:PaaI family thioesterase [Flagellimonas baculiformis]|uniref:PaaI family thioesterase n=1 Tax=Flagellimonas baculiformis TaxID=3067310 RepID=UPI00296FF866|nr:PaaI family thioesterase [Muricauda sp. D6]